MPSTLTVPAALLAACLVIRGSAFIAEWSPWVGGLWYAAAVVCLFHERAGAAAVVALSGWAMMSGHYYNHVLFMFWIAATLLLFRDAPQQRFVVRCQLSIVYGFAALAKVNQDWLAGAVLAAHGARVPEPLMVPAAIATVLVEAFLAWALWNPRMRGLMLTLAAPLHFSFWLLMGVRVFWSPGLLPFSLLSFGMLAWSTVSCETHERPATAASATEGEAALAPFGKRLF